MIPYPSWIFRGLYDICAICFQVSDHSLFALYHVINFSRDFCNVRRGDCFCPVRTAAVACSRFVVRNQCGVCRVLRIVIVNWIAFLKSRNNRKTRLGSFIAASARSIGFPRARRRRERARLSREHAIVTLSSCRIDICSNDISRWTFAFIYVIIIVFSVTILKV